MRSMIIYDDPQPSYVFALYRKLYWSQIFSLKTSLHVKWFAIRSLWIIRNFGRGH